MSVRVQEGPQPPRSVSPSQGAVSLRRSALDLRVVILPDVTLNIRDFISKFHFALNIPQWTNAMILSKTFSPGLHCFLVLSVQSIDYPSGFFFFFLVPKQSF